MINSAKSRRFHRLRGLRTHNMGSRFTAALLQQSPVNVRPASALVLALMRDRPLGGYTDGLLQNNNEVVINTRSGNI